MAALAAGTVQAMFSSPSTTMPLVRAGKIRILAVAGPTRDRNAPEAPTMSEAGLPGFESTTWFGLMAPAKTPVSALARIRADAIRAVQSPDAQARFFATGTNVIGTTAEEFKAIIAQEYKSYGELIRKIKEQAR